MGFSEQVKSERNYAQSMLVTIVKDERGVGESAENLKCWTSQAAHANSFVNTRYTAEWGKMCEEINTARNYITQLWVSGFASPSDDAKLWTKALLCRWQLGLLGMFVPGVLHECLWCFLDWGKDSQKIQLSSCLKNLPFRARVRFNTETPRAEHTGQISDAVSP